MGHCVHITFGERASQDAFFNEVSKSPYSEVLQSSVIRIIDRSSNSRNFLSNEMKFIEFEFEVKTQFLSKFIRSFLDKYDCLIKDCEDNEGEDGDAPCKVFRLA